MLVLLFLSFLLLIAIGVDVGLSMILSAWFGIAIKSDRAVDLILLPQSMMNGISFYALVQIPLFVLAGELMNRGGLTGRLIDWSLAFTGRLRGSLGHVTIVTNLIMAGVSGSAVADAVATGKPLIPAMQRRKYADGFAGAVVSAGALLGPIIPPSIPMVVYAQIANVSVLKMFMAGVVPGLMLAAGFFGICSLVARRRNYPSESQTDLRCKVRATLRASWALAMPLLVILGIRFGWFTDTEVAAIVVLYALAVSLGIYRDLRVKELPRLFFEAARSSATILFLLAAAGPFSWLVAESQVGELAVKGILTISTDPVIILLIVSAFLLLVGCLIEPLPAMVIFLPALLPVSAQLAIDPIQFGAVVVINLMIGMVTPPVGLLLFVVASISNIRMTDVVRESLPFLAWSLIVLVLLVLFPPLTTWLPGTLH